MMLDMHPWIGLSDDVWLGVLTEWVTADVVDEVLAECGKRDKKPGALPARFMVCCVLALALFQQDSYDDVAVDGFVPGVPDTPVNRAAFAGRWTPKVSQRGSRRPGW
jgi:hypothetical protein